MENFPKILVASATYEGMKYCEKDFIDSITNLDYPNYEILIVDNSENEEYFNHLKNTYQNIFILRDNNDEKNKMLRLVHSRNLILNYAIQNNYEYILMMDSDVIPPKNIIKELLICNKEIVSGLYYNYFKFNQGFKWLPVAWTCLTEQEFEELKKTNNLPDFIKSSTDLRAQLTEQEAGSGRMIETIIPSAGCMLVSKEVFTKFRYGILDTKNYGNVLTTDDIYFILEARKKGFKAYCNTKIRCEHLVKGKMRKESDTYFHPIYDNQEV